MNIGNPLRILTDVPAEEPVLQPLNPEPVPVETVPAVEPPVAVPV